MQFNEAGECQETRRVKPAQAAQRASARPHSAPMELAIQTMKRNEVEQMKRLFNTGFYLVEADRPFRDFPALLQLQGLNGLQADSSDSESDLDH